MDTGTNTLTRRRFLHYTGALGVLAGLQSIVPAYAWQGTAAAASDATRHSANSIDLRIHKKTLTINERQGTAVTVNGSVPGPLVRLREGETVTIRVTNQLEEVTSIHWHGVLVPHEMDGVPGVSFPGIKPGETFTYRYPVKQSGTYWYHSHSGLQEQAGHYGPLIIDPAEPDPFAYDREYVVMLSDWTFEDPHDVLMKLKKQSDYYNFQQRTMGDFFRDVSEKGWWATISDRLMWGRMRMDPADILDVTCYTYTYLINGLPLEANWTALFRPGERVRLRFINGSTMSYFNVRIPGLEMTVVQADGQNVEPVTVDEFQIATAETYDVIVEPKEDRAFTVFAESMDRSGYTRGTLAPQAGMSAPIPELRPPPLRTMIDMGMDMGDMGNMTGMDMDADANAGGGHAGHMAGMGMDAGSTAGGGQMGAMPGMGEKVGPVVARQGPNRYGPGNTMVPTVLRNRLGEPGTGLQNVGHRVLVYTDLRSLKPGSDQREPQREVELHLTGNMDNYMWSFDGQKFSEVRGPIPFYYGERLRFTRVNDTMMEHPIHLHGMFMELDNGSGSRKPRKHTISVKPAERLSLEITADAPGNWALHCHFLYHMEWGMFRVVNVSRRVAEDRK
jgi:CopA family copper-resistance protein